MQHDEGKLTRPDGTVLFHQRWQPESTPKAVIVIVHGFGEHSDRYVNVVNKLVPKGYAIAALDHRGHGRSSGQRVYINRWNEFRQDLRQFILHTQTRFPNMPLFMLGHSMGGLMGLDYLLRYPAELTGAIISAPAIEPANLPAPLRLAAKVMSRVWPTFSMPMSLGDNVLSRDPAVEKAAEEDPMMPNIGTPRLGTEMDVTGEWVRANPHKLQIPLLIVHGTADKLIEPASSQRFFESLTYSDVQRITYEGSYHEPHNDLDHEKVTDDMLNWLDARI